MRFLEKLLVNNTLREYLLRMNEAPRVLKPGGVYSFEEALLPHTNLLFNGYFGHISITAEELSTALSSAGYEIENFERGRFFPRCFVRARKTIDRE